MIGGAHGCTPVATLTPLPRLRPRFCPLEPAAQPRIQCQWQEGLMGLYFSDFFIHSWPFTPPCNPLPTSGSRNVWLKWCRMVLFDSNRCSRLYWTLCLYFHTTHYYWTWTNHTLKSKIPVGFAISFWEEGIILARDVGNHNGWRQMPQSISTSQVIPFDTIFPTSRGGQRVTG